MSRLFVLAATLGGLYLAAPVLHAQNIVRCESSGGQYQSCPADTRGGVTLSRQLSSQGCWQNDTWGYDRNRIWVTHGCRAEFAVGSQSSGSSGNSNSNAVAAAAVVALLGAAVLASKHHDDGRNDDDGRYDGYSFRCESNDNRYVSCPLPGSRGDVDIRRQLSKSPCRYGQSWGRDRHSVWVDDGCRAEFVVY